MCTSRIQLCICATRWNCGTTSHAKVEHVVKFGGFAPQGQYSKLIQMKFVM